MPFYVSDLVNVPKGIESRFYPRGWDQSANWSILKLDKTKIIMWSADAIPGLNLVADDPAEATSLTTKTALAALLADGRTIPAKWGDAIGDLLMNPPSNRWPALRSMDDGFFRVQMGPVLVWAAADPAGARRHSKQAFDNFNRTSNLDGSTSSDGKFTWTETAGTVATVNGTVLSITGDAISTAAQASLVLDTPDMDVQFDVVTNTRTTTEAQCGAVARGTGLVAAGGGYLGALKDASGTLTAEIFDLVDGVSLTNPGVAGVTGTLRFTANGSSLTLCRNGAVVASATDTTSTSPNKGGYRSSRDAAADLIEIDNFLIQDVGFGFRAGPRLGSFFLMSNLRAQLAGIS